MISLADLKVGTTKAQRMHHRSMRQLSIENVALRLCSVLILSACLAAQTPTFRAGTTLIELTFVAFDAQGNPVTDLTKDDIVVLEQGQPRAIEFFRFDGAPPERATGALPPNHFSNRLETGPNPARHVTAILVDAMNMPTVAKTMLFTQATVRNQILAYLDGLPPYTRVGVFQLGRKVIEVVHDFSDDLPSLKARVAKLELVRPEEFAKPGYRPEEFPKSGSGGGSPEAAAGRALALGADAKGTAMVDVIIQTRRVDLTLPGLETLANHLARFPGRKNIVWVGNGMPIRLGPRAQPVRDWGPRMRQTAERLATLGIALYPVTSRLGAEEIRESAELFANVTGGRSTRTMNDPIEGLRTTALDQRALYAVGFYAADPPDNTWHPIAVQVRRPGVSVTHRQGYLSEAAAPVPVEWGEEQWRAALANPLGSSVIRLDAEFAPARAQRAFDLQMQIALDDLHFQAGDAQWIAEVEIATAEKIASGDFTFRVERAALSKPIDSPSGAVAPYRRQWDLRADTMSVRIIVRDRSTGRYGSLDLPVGRP